MQKQYDYIITGAGCAGLSLLMRLLHEPTLCKKKILVIDAEEKKLNDRTWCFWEKGKGLFEPIVYHQWNVLSFESANFKTDFSILPYSYKMIQGLDFYNHVFNYAKQFPNVEFKIDKVKEVYSKNNQALVELEHETITATYVFNSILFNKPQLKKDNYYLLQHFTGWIIETSEPVFNADKATFMDFSVNQQHGTTFMYVLPTSSRTALVEYTLFTENLLPQAEYKKALQEYIATKLNIKNYTIKHEEIGIIPMTNFRFPLQQEQIVYIGIAGGQAKGSSGFAFNFIQKRTAQIVATLVKNNHPFVQRSFNDKKFALYDSVLLQVLQNKKMEGAAIFTAIFKKNKPQTVLQFLDNESSLLQDLQIMSSVPTNIFLPAALKEIFNY